MGEALIALFALVLFGVLLLVPVFAIVALTRTSALRGEVQALQARLKLLEARVGRAAPAVTPTPEPRPETVPQQPPEPAAPAPQPTPATQPERVVLPAPVPPATPPALAPDLATSLGPKLLVAAGALAVFASLAFFVKYAWDNEWVGPTGRVLSGAVFSLGLIALGVRLLRHEYRPLGQGLAGAGLAGLFTAVFGAHGFYDLIPRAAAFLLLVGVTTAALALAERLELRLLAALAWIGGYLTPALLSTGEDRALSLFAYLFLLDAGALFLDRRRPWPETMPLAFTGTMLLYAGWWGSFYNPARFATAAFGLVLFTALFAFGPASKQRGIFQAFVVMGASALTLAMADVKAGAGPMFLSLAVGVLALRFAAEWGAFFRLLAGFALFVPFLAWVDRYSPEQHFLTGAAWVLGAVLLSTLADRGAGGSAVFFRASAFVLGGLCAAGLAGRTDFPALVTALLLALAAIAALLRRWWAWAEAAGIVTAVIAVVAWHEKFYGAGRERDAILIAVAVSGAYLLALVVRGLLFRVELGVSGLATHLAAAALLWGMLFDVLHASNPTGLGLTSLALAALYLVIGLALRAHEPRDPLHVRTALRLAAGFVTIAIPVQLGLHGITLAWAVWGLLLLGLGARLESAPTRLGGYAILGLATSRLLARHLPLHDGPFRPLLNPSFGVWLFVIGALAAAILLTRRVRAEGSPEALVRPLLAMLALVLLFGLLTAETNAYFATRAREGVWNARLMGGLALSVLWSVFATALLAAGLGIRNRALFYAAYALFGVTALKVALVDLAALHTIYRILSFLALGVLLMAGAWLNIRFRARLLPREGA